MKTLDEAYKQWQALQPLEEWQQRLIGMICELNPNVQLIMTTHAPSIIMDKWGDYVTNVSDITDQ